MSVPTQLPDALAGWIRSHFAAAGDPSRIHFRSCRRVPFWWIPGNRDTAGLTLWNRVYLRAEYCPINAADVSSVELVFHEVIHVMQFRRNRVLFPLRYLFHHLCYGYRNNPAEVEARVLASRLVDRYFERAD